MLLIVPAQLMQAHHMNTKLKPTTLRYLTIGIVVYVFELIVIVIAVAAHMTSLVAVGLSFWLGLIVSFILQKFITFRDKRTNKKVLIPQLLAVSCLVIFNFGFTLLVTKLSTHIIPPTISRTLALGITTIWNFYLYRTRIFQTSPILPID
jgi:putative flippase GtrA